MFNSWSIYDSICLLFTFIFLIFYISIFFTNQYHNDKYLEIKVIIMCSIFGPILLFYILKTICILIKKYNEQEINEQEINEQEINSS